MNKRCEEQTISLQPPAFQITVSTIRTVFVLRNIHMTSCNWMLFWIGSTTYINCYFVATRKGRCISKTFVLGRRRKETWWLFDKSNESTNDLDPTKHSKFKKIQLWRKQLRFCYTLIIIMSCLNIYHTATMSILSCEHIKCSDDSHLNQVLKEPPEDRFQVCVCKTFPPVVGGINKKEWRNILEEVR